MFFQNENNQPFLHAAMPVRLHDAGTSLSEKLFPATRQNIIVYILLSSTLVKIIYVFFLTDYSHYLVTDMGGYWIRALERFHGKDVSINQWAVWPPFYHIFLSWLFRPIAWTGLFNLKLEIILRFHIILSAVSVYALHRITLGVMKNINAANLVAATYAFSYPLIYLNAFILTENFAIPLLIISIWILFRDGAGLKAVFASGALLAVATAARPNYGILGLPFFAYCAFSASFDKRFSTRLKKGAIFSLGFFLVLTMAVLENYRISEGRLKGLSANGGLNFYFAQTKTHGVDSTFNGWHYVIIPPSTVNHPENGTLRTSIPIYDQKYFYKLGMEHLKNNPKAWFENLARFWQFFWGPLMPSTGSAACFGFLIKVSRYVLFFMTIIAGLSFIALRNSLVDRHKLLLIMSIPFALLIVHYFFGVEQRYLYSFEFVIHILFFTTLYAALERFKGLKKTPAEKQISQAKACGYQNVNPEIKSGTTSHELQADFRALTSQIIVKLERKFHREVAKDAREIVLRCKAGMVFYFSSRS